MYLVVQNGHARFPSQCGSSRRRQSSFIERDDGRSYGLMHAEQGPSGRTGWKYYDSYCLLVRRITIFIYHGQAPSSQISRAEHSFLCSITVVNKETDLLPQLQTAAQQGNLVEQVDKSLLMTRLTTIMSVQQPQQGHLPIKGATPSGLGIINQFFTHPISAHPNA